jgi:5-oxoprolinase (ATP-hydrolysing)
LKIGELALKLGFENVSLSHQISSMIRAVPRGLTTCIDSYLTPSIYRYLKSFTESFSDKVNVLFMQSDGGLTSMSNFTGSRAILSGPAGGVVGYACTSYTDLFNYSPVIGFDMGGTSTDVSRFAGNYEHVFETITAGYMIQAPQLDINTIASGGGSMLFFQSGLFVVGPESASSNPGPACYKKNGPLTITDANLLLGRIQPEFFPKIFGENQNEELGLNETRRLFQNLTQTINQHQLSNNLKEMTIEDVALGFIKVANESMCRPIRNLTEGKGYDTRKHILACFGGAGGQHTTAIARSLGIKNIIVNRYSGLLSAYGLSMADVVYEKQEPCHLELNKANMIEFVSKLITKLNTQCIQFLIENENFDKNEIETEVFLNLRYEGTDTSLMCSSIDNNDISKFISSFIQKYIDEYGFTLDRRIFIDDVRVRGVGKTNIYKHKLTISQRHNSQPKLKPISIKNVYFEGGFVETNIYSFDDILLDDSIEGPAIIVDKNSTILIEPNCVAFINKSGDIQIEILPNSEVVSTEQADIVDTTQLSIFSHRFMSIAEQTGRILQRTSVSTNIKERLDYSCAMFDSDGGLVANAPHIPVHLGAMQEAVKYQIEFAKTCPFKQGDVILTNHPDCGGSHLPDLTVITPVFNAASPNKPVFFVANRGHHSDIGGLTPGSMPPNSTKLWQEGAAFKSVKIVENNILKEDLIKEAFNEPSKYPGCSGTRQINDNLSDLKAQIAANKKGIDLINNLIDEYKLEVVLSYMKHIQMTAQLSVIDLLKSMSNDDQNRNDFKIFKAQDFMDDGSNIDIQITVDKKEVYH